MRDSDIPRCLSVYHLHYPLSTKEAEDKIDLAATAVLRRCGCRFARMNAGDMTEYGINVKSMKNHALAAGK